MVVGLLFWPRVIVAEAGLGTELLLFVANLGFNAIKLPFGDGNNVMTTGDFERPGIQGPGSK